MLENSMYYLLWHPELKDNQRQINFWYWHSRERGLCCHFARNKTHRQKFSWVGYKAFVLWTCIFVLFTFANLYFTGKADTKTLDFHEIHMTTIFNELELGRKQEVTCNVWRYIGPRIWARIDEVLGEVLWPPGFLCWKSQILIEVHSPWVFSFYFGKELEKYLLNP